MSRSREGPLRLKVVEVVVDRSISFSRDFSENSLRFAVWESLVRLGERMGWVVRALCAIGSIFLATPPEASRRSEIKYIHRQRKAPLFVASSGLLFGDKLDQRHIQSPCFSKDGVDLRNGRNQRRQKS